MRRAVTFGQFLAWLAITGLLAGGAIAPAGAAPTRGTTNAPAGATLAEADLTRYVDPLIGTAATTTPLPVPFGAAGNTFPGATAPFGMIQPGPDTPGARPSGYRYEDEVIEGFSLTHYNGTGCANGENLPLLPVIGPLGPSPGTSWGRYTATFSHASEVASAGYYRVRLDRPGIETELTATSRTAMARFTYPATTEAVLLLDLSHHATGSLPASASIAGNDRITGTVAGGNFCLSGQYYAIHFVMQLDRPFRSAGTWLGDVITPGATSVSGAPAGLYLTFDTSDNPVVQVKIGLSYVSRANAQLNLETENPGWDFAAVRQATGDAWNRLLNRVQVSGGTPDTLRQLYTALYHVLLNPHLASDVNGQYLGFDDQVHTAGDFTYYADFAGWDIYRSWVPLMAVIAPGELADVIRSLVIAGQQGGALPRWSTQNRESGAMVGDPGALVVASAYAFGVRRFDAQAALALMDRAGTDPQASVQGKLVRPGLGEYLRHRYLPAGSIEWPPAAVTLEYATADFAIAQLARALGDNARYGSYMTRAQYWRNVYHPESGFIAPRNADGSWVTPLNPAAEPYVEGNAAQFVWLVPYNLEGLFERMGGRANAIQRLDHLFAEVNAGMARPHFYIGNQSQYATPWAYTFAGVPWKTQQVVRRVLLEAFDASPSGLPGNDDLGATSSWYVWAALGLYPAIAGTDVLVLHGPLFPAVTIRPGDGRTFHIAASGAGPGSPYIQAVAVNGQPASRTWLSFSQLAGGGTVQLVMGPLPNPTWGTRPADLPPSFTDGAPVGNLALNKPVLASGACTAAESPEKAVDGFLHERNKWCAPGARPWLRLDLGQPAIIGRLVVRHAGAGGELPLWNTRDFTIRLSVDGITWTTIAEVRGNQASVTSHPIPGVIARYLQLDVLAPEQCCGGGAARIYELEVYGQLAPFPGRNLARDALATADGACAPGETAERAVDGIVGNALIPSSKWCAPGAGRWLQLDLKQPARVSAVVVKHAGFGAEDAGRNTRDFTIRLSVDGATWTTVAEVRGNRAARTVHTLPPTAARFVRLNVLVPTSLAGDVVTRIYELEVYGPGDAP